MGQQLFRVSRGVASGFPAAAPGGNAFIRQFINLTASGQTGFPPPQSLTRSVIFPSNVLPHSTILIFATQSNGGSPGATIGWTDSFGSSYGLLQQADDTVSPDWQSLYAYTAYDVAGGSCTLNATFSVLIWQGIVALEVANVVAAPLVTSNKSQQSLPGTGTDAITVAGLAGGSNPAIIIGACCTGSDLHGAPNHGTGYTEYLQDWNWAGAEGTPNVPTLEIESKFLVSPGSTDVTWTAPIAGDNYEAIGVILRST